MVRRLRAKRTTQQDQTRSLATNCQSEPRYKSMRKSFDLNVTRTHLTMLHVVLSGITVPPSRTLTHNDSLSVSARLPSTIAASNASAEASLMGIMAICNSICIQTTESVSHCTFKQERATETEWVAVTLQETRLCIPSRQEAGGRISSVPQVAVHKTRERTTGCAIPSFSVQYSAVVCRFCALLRNSCPRAPRRVRPTQTVREGGFA